MHRLHTHLNLPAAARPPKTLLSLCALSWQRALCKRVNVIRGQGKEHSKHTRILFRGWHMPWQCLSFMCSTRFIFTLTVTLKSQVNVNVIHMCRYQSAASHRFMEENLCAAKNHPNFERNEDIEMREGNESSSNSSSGSKNITSIIKQRCQNSVHTNRTLKLWIHTGTRTNDSGQFILIFFKQNRKIELIADVLKPLIWRFWRVNMDNEISSFTFHSFSCSPFSCRSLSRSLSACENPNERVRQQRRQRERESEGEEEPSSATGTH